MDIRKMILAAVVMAAMILPAGGAAAGGGEGLSKDDLKEITGSFTLDDHNRALMNAITNNDLKSLTLDREKYNSHDAIFSDKVDAKGITNQKSSGRCWMFAGFNVMRPAVMDKFNLSSFEFSENYLFFWDKLEKANLFLEAIIETAGRDIDDRELQALLQDPVPDGGWWNYYADLIDKYGVVPVEVCQETTHTSNTRYMNGVINRMARYDAVRIREMAANDAEAGDLRKCKMKMLKEIYRVLVLFMGEPSERFTWRVENKEGEIIEKEYTPGSFYREAVDVDLSDYVTIMDHAAYPYGRFYRIDYCRGMYDRPDMGFINLDIEEMKKYAVRVVQDNEPVWFAADIGKENNAEDGILLPGMYDYESLLGIDHRLTKAQLIRYRGGSANHAMVFVAVDIKDGKPVKWKVENSWGADRGDKGYWTMYDEWFSRYVFNVIIHKKHLPAKVVKLLDTEPVRIPAWDPMRLAFE